MNMLLSCILLFSFCITSIKSNKPIVINTWRFEQANAAAWSYLKEEKSAVDAIVRGCSECEIEQCDSTVGYGGSPDENGETILDAMIMDGKTMNVGSVISMRRIKNAIGVARVVMEHTEHSILSGERATEFATQMGFKQESLVTDFSEKVWENWRNNNCQPNFWKDVLPDPKTSCGPYRLYKPSPAKLSRDKYNVGPNNHDTIGMLAIDADGNLAAGTSTNGATHKIPGRVADSGIPGSGCYADQSVGAAAATGDGDIMMRFSPSFLAVEEMRRGASPTLAAETAIIRIAERYPTFSGAVITLSNQGSYGAACYGIEEFPFCVTDATSEEVRVEKVPCVRLNVSQQDSNDV